MTLPCVKMQNNAWTLCEERKNIAVSRSKNKFSYSQYKFDDYKDYQCIEHVMPILLYSRTTQYMGKKRYKKLLHATIYMPHSWCTSRHTPNLVLRDMTAWQAWMTDGKMNITISLSCTTWFTCHTHGTLTAISLTWSIHRIWYCITWL